MDVNTIVQLINGCGFPIVAFFVMVWMIVEDRKSRAEEREKWTTAINANTKVLTRLTESIEKGGISNGTVDR